MVNQRVSEIISCDSGQCWRVVDSGQWSGIMMWSIIMEGDSPISVHYLFNPGAFTAVRQGLSKYLTAQDTHISPTSTKHGRNISIHNKILSLRSQSTIQEYRPFLLLVLGKLIRKPQTNISIFKLNQPRGHFIEIFKTSL